MRLDTYLTNPNYRTHVSFTIIKSSKFHFLSLYSLRLFWVLVMYELI